jgi:hypothetical protein
MIAMSVRRGAMFAETSPNRNYFASAKAGLNGGLHCDIDIMTQPLLPAVQVAQRITVKIWGCCLLSPSILGRATCTAR